MTWRLAKSLGVLRDQFDLLAPGRATDSDGTIGNEAHQATVSDHNPDKWGVVAALDITHDPSHGVDTYDIAEQFRLGKDTRIKYVISNRRIMGGKSYAERNGVSPWTWGHYRGVNPHDHHIHVSVNRPTYDQIQPWVFHLLPASGPIVAGEPLLRRGSKGERVSYLQGILHTYLVDGNFGPDTDAGVRAFQTSHGLVADGVVGPATWKAFLEGGPIPAPPLPTVWASGKGSWYSQFSGKYEWVDKGDKPGSAALGVSDTEQGISRYAHETLGKWFEVEAPNGVKSIEQQTDIGPAPWTGRGIDISSAAAERFGYSPNNFPTDGIFKWRLVPVPTEVAMLSPQEQAKKFYEARGRSVVAVNRPVGP